MICRKLNLYDPYKRSTPGLLEKYVVSLTGTIKASLPDTLDVNTLDVNNSTHPCNELGQGRSEICSFLSSPFGVNLCDEKFQLYKDRLNLLALLGWIELRNSKFGLSACVVQTPSTSNKFHSYLSTSMSCMPLIYDLNCFLYYIFIISYLCVPIK